MADYAQIVKDTVGGIGDLMAIIQGIRDRSVNSLTAYTKQTLISSRVYIEDIIADDPNVMNILVFLNQMHGSFVLSALGLSNLIGSCKTAKRMISAVGTEGFMEKLVGTEDAQEKKYNYDIKEVKTDPKSLFVGRILEASVGIGNEQAKLSFLVQLVPMLIPTIVTEQFLANNAEPSKVLRWAQVKTGEIKFWRDFVFETDRIQKRSKALRVDKEGILRELEDTRKAQVRKGLMNYIAISKDAVRRNVANSIMVCSKRTMDTVCSELGINMKNPKDRQNVMTNTMTMMIAVYDPNYQMVDVYYNGLDTRGEYSIKMLEGFAKKESSIDLKQLLTIIAAGSAPRI